LAGDSELTKQLAAACLPIRSRLRMEFLDFYLLTARMASVIIKIDKANMCTWVTSFLYMFQTG
jgi:hypothetical protein